MTENKPIRIGTRRSKLALWQAHHVQAMLQNLYPERNIKLVHFVTQGDKILDKSLPEIGGKGLFTLELENALKAGEIDMAVHSLKDLPTEMPEGFAIGAIPKRATPFDALVSRNGQKLADLPEGAVIGTSSLRRAAQLKVHRPDFVTRPIRGNVETRIKKAHDAAGDYHATILAVAGLERLEKQDVITEIMDMNVMLPAPGQGAIGVQCRADDPDILPLLKSINNQETRICVTAERAFLQHLEAGCRLPVSAYGILERDMLKLIGRVSGLSGEKTITVTGKAPVEDSFKLGVEVAKKAIARGADKLLEAVRKEYPL